QYRGGLGVVLEPSQRVTPARDVRGDAPDPRSARLTEAVDDPWPHPGVPLAGIVEKSSEQDLVAGHTLCAERRDDIEAVASVGDVHRIEHGERRRREPLDEPHSLVDAHARRDLRAELPSLTGPVGS